MKKYILLCLLAGSAFLASMQTYAYLCLPLGISPIAYAECMAACLVLNPAKPTKYCL
ncbi:hypothetical protein HZS38_08450 [Xenorhabdus nematophila]|uniref:Uncharacterized protein n=1 Tax=Xenorhabdus nematophila (strain ATCC 19061 / DSM 3370 / CCUG 14189 / LMG 1036 / NCIMB 9965 / AN6) TaxID=406817 RepID=D3VD42_XENNA|nr:hypothetical protein [Xenorhabdus nematophila]MBA0019173.1 hypothetical protein [Xenorhabdus nematophila]QNJ38073.1 hypothetical protein H8F46_08135 [Xenorhabdus nematophila]CBJ89908.1 hypothetical protein; putative exported protein [Xenorhabdus nematophila ATCC 19061]CEF33731.1 hypothetical protein; putative exported protein [Xenorhabdus nematophila str. Websteri]